MNKVLVIMTIVLGVFFLGCENGSTNESNPGEIVIRTFDAPFGGDVEHIYLNIEQVSVHKAVADSGADTTAQWIVLSDVDTTIDFLELVNGEMATLIQTNLEAGQYSQLRLLLGASSQIVIDGTSYSLRVPSGSQSGVKLNLGFSINSDELIEIYLDFDAERSINKHPNQNRYTLQPTFRVFKSVLSGTIAGTVSDTLGNGVQDVSIYAVANDDSVTTLTDENGQYKLILLAGTYDLSAAGFNLQADTTFAGVELSAEDELIGFDFQMK
ncbi:MAG: DUF4382 domain-containing protein [Candidatus Marinimicrobia bacterium]|nr:DUF4382 domain-containing protein [Candidatus Neomarinimicrobiota bacterium]